MSRGEGERDHPSLREREGERKGEGGGKYMYDVLEVLFNQFYLKHTIMTVVLSKCVLRICSKLVFVLCCVDGQLFVSMATRLSKKGNGCFKVSQCVCMQGSVFMVYYLIECMYAR